MTAPFVRNPYNYDVEAASQESGLECKDPTLAQQHFKEECDINTLVERFHLTGEIPIVQRQPLDIEYAEIFDFRQAQHQLIEADRAFMQLPAKIRAQFDNDPMQFVEFALNPDNKDDLKKWGMLKPEPAPQDPPAIAPATPQAAPAAKT